MVINEFYGVNMLLLDQIGISLPFAGATPHSGKPRLSVVNWLNESGAACSAISGIKLQSRQTGIKTTTAHEINVRAQFYQSTLV